MKSLWRDLGIYLARDGMANASLMWAAGLRAIRFPRRHLALFRVELFTRYVVGAEGGSLLFHLSHRHYLSNSFTPRERVDCALSHHRFEDARYDVRYKTAVYRGGGIDLWSRRVGDARYVLRLRSAGDLRHEGGLSVVLCVEDTVLCEMSYAWVDATVLGLERRGTVPFITRNQSIVRDAPALARFREAFPQNSPTYFCLAAIHGIVQAHGIDRLAGIRHDRQVAFESRYVDGFRHSYSDLWQSFGAVETGTVAHEMPVPLAVPPIETVRAKHRRRALERRANWSEITRTARSTLSSYLRPAPRDAARPSDAVAATVARNNVQAVAFLVASLVC